MKPSDFVSTSGQKQAMSQSVLQTEMTDAVNTGIVGRADKSEKSLKSGLYSVGKKAATGGAASAALAAVQVDHLTRVIIVRSDFDDKTTREFTPLINPEIVKYEGEQVEDYEGCLSVSRVYGRVKRASKIRIRALNTDGQKVRFKAEGFLARVIQHEVDHCNGLLFIDHIRDQTDAFYRLDHAGELKPLDYDKHIKDNHDLWPEDE